MNALKADILARDLVRMLGQLCELYYELASRMRERLEAVRQADADRIQAAAAVEQELVGRLREREGLGRQLARRLAEATGHAAPRDATTSELAGRLPEPRRSQLLLAAAGLRDRVREVERLQAVLGLVTREMMVHLGQVLEVMRSGGRSSESYSRTGASQRVGTAGVFEAVG